VLELSMMGIPGAGKTTAARLIADITGAKYLSSDELRLKLWPKPKFTQSEHDELYRQLDMAVAYLLQNGKSVIYDANLNRYEHRQDKYDLCKRVKANPLLIWVKADRELAKSRMQERAAHHLVPSWETPESMFERISDILQEPSKNEKTLIVDGAKISVDYLRAILKYRFDG
jgi:predicted kinase